MLKITPSHDFVDLNIARRHKEEIDDEAMNRCCIDEQGRLVNAPGFNGLDRFEARSKVCSSASFVCKYFTSQCIFCNFHRVFVSGLSCQSESRAVFQNE